MPRSRASSARANRTPGPACTESSRSCERPAMPTPDTFTELLREELSPAPDSEFAREMDEWAAAGFPRREREAKERQPRFRAWLSSPLGMATATTAVAAIAIVAVMAGDSFEQGTHGSSEPGLSTVPSSEDAAPAP